MKHIIQTFTIILLFVTLSYAFYPDSAYIMGYTHTWLAIGEVSGNRVTVRDTQGYIHAVYCYRLASPYNDSSEIYYVYSTDNGLTWSTPENVSMTDTCESKEPNIAIDSQDHLHCVWKQFYDDTVTGYHDYDMYYSMKDGSGWTPPMNISNQHLGINACYSSMVVDSLDHVHVVYDMSTGAGNWDIFYTYYNDTVWSAPYQISNTPYDDAFPSMAIDHNNHLHVVWRQRTINAPVYYTEYNGGTWTTPEIITDFTSGQSACPCIVVDSNNCPRVALSWSNLPTNASEIYYIAHDGTSWSLPLNISNTVNISEALSMAIDSLDQLYVVWMEETPLPTYDVYYRTYNGSTWSVVMNLTQDSSFSYCPKLGNPIKGEKIDLVWVDGWSVPAPAVMYMGLNLTGIAEEATGVLIEKPLMLNIRPIPFRNSITITYSVPAIMRIKLALYDISGRLITEIIHDTKSPGKYKINWSGENLPPGVYFLKLEGGEYSAVKKLIKIK